jgi:hypothetical protein
VDSDRPLLAANLDFTPNRWLEVNLFLVQQQVDGLTDRQAVGGGIQYLDEDGYFFGFIDYDTFYDVLNTLSLTLNQRISASWSLNFSLSGGYAPILSTLNALQGQSVNSISELEGQYSNSEIYDLARDRVSKSESLSLGATYQIDSSRYLYVNLSGFRLDGTQSSGGVEGIDEYQDVQFVADYSFQGFLLDNDYATLGMRLSDSTNNEIISLRARTRFSGYGNLIYEPGMQLDHRTRKDNQITQIILRSAIQVQYRISRTLSFEGDFAFEYSDFDLPEVNNQYSYSTYIGYTYLF